MKTPKNTIIVNTETTEYLFRFLVVPLLMVLAYIVLSLACSLSRIIPLLSNQTITFHTKQLPFNVLKY